MRPGNRIDLSHCGHEIVTGKLLKQRVAPLIQGLPQSWGCPRQEGIVAPFVGGESGRVAWILRLVEIGAEGEGQAQDVMEIDRSGGLGDIAALGLTLSETKQLLAALQQ
jgi:hypothetical protein